MIFNGEWASLWEVNVAACSKMRCRKCVQYIEENNEYSRNENLFQEAAIRNFMLPVHTSD